MDVRYFSSTADRINEQTDTPASPRGNPMPVSKDALKKELNLRNVSLARRIEPRSNFYKPFSARTISSDMRDFIATTSKSK